MTMTTGRPSGADTPPTDSTIAIVARTPPRLDRPEAPHHVRRDRPAHAVLVLTAGLAIIFLYPLIWTAISSVSPLAGTNQTDGWGLGNYITLANYQAGIWVYLFNSTFVSLLTVLLTLVVSLLGGYAFARFRFPGKDLLFLSTLAILMVPYATLLIPLYVMLNAVGLSNSLAVAWRSCSRCSSCRSRCS